MRKITQASVFLAGFLASFSVFSDTATICGATATAGKGIAPASGTANTHFMLNPIAPRCSANVHLAGTDGTSGAWYAVGSASSKGANSFKGHTNGGAVARHADCATKGACLATDAETARDSANSAAAS
ncbi:MAG: hypothetical protein V4623_01220 [Pseudomonadota bacterium]